MELRLIKNSPDHWEFIRKLRLDSENIDGFLEKVEISEEDQINYMKTYGDFYYICLDENTPVGYVGVIEGDMRMCVSSNKKKSGIGTFMLSEIMKIKPESTAKVLKSNIASLAMCKKCNLIIVSEDETMFYLKHSNHAFI
jgi:hypothetical protein